MRIGYARVSTDEQNLDLQIDALKRAGCNRILKDVISGKSRKRPGLDKLIAQLGPGDTVVVWRLSRLGRNFYHLVDVAQHLHATGAKLVSLTEGFDTSTPLGEAIFRILCIFADLERSTIVENTIAGIAAARRRGAVIGRPPKLKPEEVAEIKALLDAKASAEDIARRYGVDRSTVYRHGTRRKIRENPPSDDTSRRNVSSHVL